MTEVSLKEPSLNDIPPEKLKPIEEKYHSFKAEVVSEEKELSIKQTEKLKDFISQLTQIKSKVVTVREECQQQNAKLSNDISAREKKLEGFQVGAKNFQLEAGYKNKIAEEEKKYVSNCQKRTQIADSINYEKLVEIEIDERKSMANEVFRWILVSIYIEPDNKYYWSNFKEQVLEEKQARFDLKERLGKVSAYNSKEEQRVQTSKFIQVYDKVKEAPELKVKSKTTQKFQSQIEKIYQIARIFLQCCEIAKHVKSYEKKVEESRKQNSKEDEDLAQMRRECDALIEKFNLGELYLKQLVSVENAMTAKLAKYTEEVQLAETYTIEMENMSVSKMSVPLEQEKRENCQCSIY